MESRGALDAPFCGKLMSPTSAAPPVILIAAPQEHSLGSVLKETRYSAAVQVHTGTLALAWAPDLRPDTIILDAELPDMSGRSASRMMVSGLRSGAHASASVPVCTWTAAE